jgi:AraC-like DNA-binding protein
MTTSVHVTSSETRPSGDHAGAGPPTLQEIHQAPGKLFITPPPEDLAPLVEYLWQLELPAGESPDAFWRVVVDGYVDVSVRVSLESSLLRAATDAGVRNGACRAVADALAASPTFVCGSAATARALPLAHPTLLTGVRFRLGHASHVLRSSVDGLVDGARPLRDVLVGRGAATAQALASVAERPTCATARQVMLEAVSAAAMSGSVSRSSAAVGDEEAAAETLRYFARAGTLALARSLVARGATRTGHAASVDRVRHALLLLDRLNGSTPTPVAELEADAAARVSAVARTLAVSPRTLARLFAEHVGYAPRTYLRLRRVGAVAEALEQEAWSERAQHDAATRSGVGGATPGTPLRESDASVGPARRGAAVMHGTTNPVGRRARRPATLSEIAYRIGYSDHAHMTREFTRVMGTPPSRYRQDARELPLLRRIAPVTFERTVPWGGIGRAVQRADDPAGVGAQP